MHLSPFGNLVVLFAVVGVCTLAVWTIDLADRLLTRFVPFLKGDGNSGISTVIIYINQIISVFTS